MIGKTRRTHAMEMPVGKIEPHRYCSLFSDRMIVATGLGSGAPASGAGPLKKGLKIVVILSGKERIELDGHPTFEIAGPQSCVILNQHEDCNVHWAAFDTPVRFVLIQVSLPFVQDELGLDIGRLLQKMRPQGKPLLFVHSANQAVEALASQMLTCPMRRSSRDIYLAGKGLELLACAVDAMFEQAEANSARLLPGDFRKIHAAYDHLVRTPGQPLTLSELSRHVGLSPSKLTDGFRRLFGTTVFGVLQEHRLQQAHQMLSSGLTTVSETAHRVGYSPAHFATLFRQRFGISPSKLRQT